MYINTEHDSNNIKPCNKKMFIRDLQRNENVNCMGHSQRNEEGGSNMIDSDKA